ncbi:MAG: hypothetical protein HON27_05185 [Candidatus Marinimicrobia bacterium]|nr:hypothetical protein [Candidatus Neomarinimicrobiota bacterium]MBT5314174.1 hypothetical protein [Candidatus Neomarinimicrobiota bacterium]
MKAKKEHSGVLEKMTLRIFTHPACSGCGPAVELGWKLSESVDDLLLETVKLENKAGLAHAQKVGIKTIPSLIFYRDDVEQKRIVGLPKAEFLQEVYEELKALNK